MQYKENKNKYINNLNTFNNENYFRISNNIKNKNNDEKKLVKYSINNALNMKSFENHLISTNTKINTKPNEKKVNNDINKDKKGEILNNNNINIIKQKQKKKKRDYKIL